MLDAVRLFSMSDNVNVYSPFCVLKGFEGYVKAVKLDFPHSCANISGTCGNCKVKGLRLLEMKRNFKFLKDEKSIFGCGCKSDFFPSIETLCFRISAVIEGHLCVWRISEI